MNRCKILQNVFLLKNSVNFKNHKVPSEAAGDCNLIRCNGDKNIYNKFVNLRSPYEVSCNIINIAGIIILHGTILFVVGGLVSEIC